jgi:hypothetical protein
MGKGNAWTQHVTKFYREMKDKNPAYKFKDALRAAASTFKKMPKMKEEAQSHTKKHKRVRHKKMPKMKKEDQSHTKKHKRVRHSKVKSRQGTRRH